MKFKQYEIWLTDLNPQMGADPGKIRPVLIVQSNLLNQIHPSTVIIPLTTNVHKEVFLIRININEKECGLEKKSAIMIDQLRVIDNKRLLRKIGKLTPELILEVKSSLSIVLDLGDQLPDIQREKI